MKKSFPPKRKIKSTKVSDLNVSWGRNYKTKELKCDIICTGRFFKKRGKNENVSREN